MRLLLRRFSAVGGLLLFALLCVLGLGMPPATGGKLALSPTQTQEQLRRTLTFAERIAYQRAIEEVYWRHRIWPKERPDPKPSLDSVMSEAQLEKKVTEYLRKSQALGDYWQRPITAEQLQAELDRMAQNTKQPEVLKELFDALRNDPFVIAECLARPALADRLLTSWYAHDERIHGALKQRIEAELRAHPTVEQMKQLSGKYSEIELAKRDIARDADDRGAPDSVKLNNREWDETVQKLALTFGIAKNSTARTEALSSAARSASNTPASTVITQIKTGLLSPLRDEETHYYARAVLSKSADRIKLATVAWDKEPLESWITKAENEVSYAVAVPATSYTIPNITGGGCIDDTWTDTSVGPDSRGWYPAVWTGSEMIFWGGTNGGYDIATGWRYNPSTDTWAPTSITNAPTEREFHSAVWTGSEMIVWGGRRFDFSGYQYFNNGGRYNPSTDTWVPTGTANAPSARAVHTAVWTGSEMIVWGGLYCSPGCVFFNTGGRYNPSTDSWTATSITNAPVARVSHTAVWTGGEMIIWGGDDGGGSGLNTGGRYSPNTDSWTATSTTNVPSGRVSHTAVWTGSQMIVWGGQYNSTELNTGGRYDPNTNSWTATSTTNVPSGRDSHTAVWTGSDMIVWGGSGDLNTGGRYSPNTDSWTATSTTSVPSGRDEHTAVWTGKEMIVWGGFNFSEGGPLNTGGRYDPISDSWTATAFFPSQRSFHTAVWTGNEMIIWGGIFDFANFLNTGSRYDRATDNWHATSTTNAADGRFLHTAVWTGSEMIVWGGVDNQNNYLNTGGRYNPNMNSWIPTTVTNAPSGREGQAAVWSGSEMIVWGGYLPSGGGADTGGRYNPDTDSWIATSTTNAPSPRAARGVWTGTEMIVWGGYNGTTAFNTGGRYNPNSDSWTATNIANAPDARTTHAVVWTGTEMIVWGGFFPGGQQFNTGGKYNPANDSWAATSLTNVPTARYRVLGVWTGSEMIIWGGETTNGDALNSGGKYYPTVDQWIATSITNAPDARYSHTAVWTGQEMIVWGGTNNGGNTEFNTGGRYCAEVGPPPSPTATSTGTPLPTATATATATVPPTPTPPPCSSYTFTTMTGQVIVPGTVDIGNHFDDGTTPITLPFPFIFYGNSFTNAVVSSNGNLQFTSNNSTWANDCLPTVFMTDLISPFWDDLRTDASGSGIFTSVTGTCPNRIFNIEWRATYFGGGLSTNFEIRLYEGTGQIDYVYATMNSGSSSATIGVQRDTGTASTQFSCNAPVTDGSKITWTITGCTNPTPNCNTPTPSPTPTATATATPTATATASPTPTPPCTDDTWTPTSITNTPAARWGHTAVWTGSEMIVWGGAATFGCSYLNTGARYNPITDTWIPISTTNAPSARSDHTAVWTGTEMIVWGGYNCGNTLNTGGRYNPNTDTWTAASTANAPLQRDGHTAVWTGSEMIVWGGVTATNDFNDGGRYNPNTDSWTATSTNNAPSGRYSHTAVWTGSEMIVWGGEFYNGITVDFDTGGRYNPNTDTWVATNVTNAPHARVLQTAVWTGGEMIVWGGSFYNGTNYVYNTGGRYIPDTDAWTATTITEAPSARYRHTAIWTGTEMIVWGAINSNTGGRYNPNTDSWTVTSTTNVPSGRNSHTAVWTGREMIVWGGYYGNEFLNSGARYCAAAAPTPIPSITPTPTPTSTPSSTPTPTPAGQPLNLSTRMLVQTGDNVAIGGFIITGSHPKRLYLRGLGPSLANSGVPNPLADPVLELHGPPGFVTITNDNWRDGSCNCPVGPCDLGPPNDLESCILQNLDPGAYTAILRGNHNGTGVGLVEVYDIEATASELTNISTRAFVSTGADIVIGGFILGNGTMPANVIVRGIGPSLTGFGVPDVLANPQLELRNSSGTLIRSNDNWMDDPAQKALIMAAGLGPTNMLESAMYETLAPGQYTTLLSGVNNGTGVGLVEAYDLGGGEPPPPNTPTPTATVGGTPSPSPSATPSPSPSVSPSPSAAPPCTENWDSVTAPALPPGWVASNPDPGDGTLWVTTTAVSDSAPNNAFIPDQDGISDKVLDRPGVQVTSASATLSFRNNFNTEMSGGIFCDAYVLEVSAPNISGGEFLDITDSHVGGSFVTGGYNVTISTACGAGFG
jgi:N-acetylneuraminic acid mutarotase